MYDRCPPFSRLSACAFGLPPGAGVSPVCGHTKTLAGTNPASTTFPSFGGYFPLLLLAYIDSPEPICCKLAEHCTCFAVCCACRTARLNPANGAKKQLPQKKRLTAPRIKPATANPRP